MTDLTHISSLAQRLPGRVIHARGLDDMDANAKQEFADDVIELANSTINNVVWAGAAEDPMIVARLQTEYEIDSELPPIVALEIALEMQPDIAEKIESALDALYTKLITNDLAVA